MISKLFHRVRMHLRRKTDPIDLLKQLAGPGLRLETLVHVGAHLAQERHKYEAAGFRDILWVEGSGETFRRLSQVMTEHLASGTRTKHQVACALLSDRDGEEVLLNTFSNDGMSSSIYLPTEESLQRWPGVRNTGQGEAIITSTLDRLLESTGHAGRVDVLLVDVQGAELQVLQGADRTLREVSAVVCEISTVPYYKGGVLYPELKSCLAGYGFHPQSAPRRHGDMLFLRGEAPA